RKRTQKPLSSRAAAFRGKGPLQLSQLPKRRQALRCSPRHSSSPAQRLIQLVLQSQIPNQPVQIIRVHSQYSRRFHVIPASLLHRIQNQLLLQLLHAAVILPLGDVLRRILLQQRFRQIFQQNHVRR